MISMACTETIKQQVVSVICCCHYKVKVKLRGRMFFSLFVFFLISVFQSADLLKQTAIGWIWGANSVCLFTLVVKVQVLMEPTWSSQTHGSFFCWVWNLTCVNSQFCLFVRVLKSTHSPGKCFLVCTSTNYSSWKGNGKKEMTWCVPPELQMTPDSLEQRCQMAWKTLETRLNIDCILNEE